MKIDLSVFSEEQQEALLPVLLGSKSESPSKRRS